MDSHFLKDHSVHASRLLKVLSNEKRFEIACILRSGEQSVGELEKAIGLSQSALSQHLARLRRDNIVKTRRSAQTIYYSLACEKTSQLLEALCEILSCESAQDHDAA